MSIIKLNRQSLVETLHSLQKGSHYQVSTPPAGGHQMDTQVDTQPHLHAECMSHLVSVTSHLFRELNEILDVNLLHKV